ncbi:MAG: helix-turn-helix domain-containing protein [Prevotellaceae bacterium]|nr:helix-turn-helix domain-containing protein [Prevotellaceae bacterium]
MKRTILHILFIFVLGITEINGQENVRIVRYTYSDGLLNMNVSCAIQDSIGYIWLSTHDGLVRYDGNRFKTYKARVGDDCPLSVNRIDYIGEDKNHDILCNSDSKNYRFRRDICKFELTTDSILDYRHNIDYRNTWEARLKQLPEYNNLKIKVRLIDNQGGIWVNSVRGLERVTFTKPKIKPIKESKEKEEEVRAMMLDKSKRLWIADKNGYIRIYSSIDFRQPPVYLSSSGTLSANRIRFGSSAYCIFEDSHNRIWIGTKPDGLFLLKPTGNGYSVKQFKKGSELYNISSDDIYRVLEDKQGKIWIATFDGGINIFNEEKQGFINLYNDLKQHPKDCINIHGMDITSNGILVIGTYKGIFTCDTKLPINKLHFYNSVRRINDNKSLSANNVSDVICTDNGDVWVSTVGGGIGRIVSKSLLQENIDFQSYSSANGTATDVFITLTSDINGRIWGVGRDILTGIDDMVVNYMESIFEGDFVFSECRPLRLPDGSILFGTTQGCLHIKANDIEKNTFVPTIVFDTPSLVELNPGDKHVRIDFAALDFNHNEPIMYRYRLEGIDEDWHYTKEPFIEYTNFPIGTYRLVVSSSNSDGVWVDNEQSITITRHAAFNETWYAWMLYGILLVFVVYIIFMTVKYIRNLKSEMAERSKEMDMQLDMLANKVKELIKNNAETIPEIDVQPDDDSVFSDKAKDFVLDNISNPEITVEDFAKHMNMSSSLLYLKCKKVLGYTPNNYLQTIRIKYATRLMVSASDANISDIAYKCGFSDPKYFSRVFKRATGYNPREYREKNKDQQI